MKTDRKKLIQRANNYRVDKGSHFRLKDFDPSDKDDFEDPDDAEEMLAAGVRHMSELQVKLYAQQQWSLLLIFQAMDAAGKDGTIGQVMSGINPQGCQVSSFKAPSSVELSHDYLWRSSVALPERGRIGIFNRSYYEEVLVVRVHPEILAGQRIPPALVTKDIWEERFEDIRAYERHLTRNGVVIRKFFLHVSKGEQRKRFLARLDEPAKNWKFSDADLKEREHWGEYQEAYQDAIRNTATPNAPWYVVPADHKWFAHLVVAGAIVETLESLKLALPEITDEQRKVLAKCRHKLED
jgi:PPK2 family polyphosphate:nucleotide phosphotransferase